MGKVCGSGVDVVSLKETPDEQAMKRYRGTCNCDGNSDVLIFEASSTLNEFQTYRFKTN